ncbi:helix-turn-helix domain-containing protein [Saccharopolyspora sp. NPDC050389]|uniref:helix-turn-helix domain-containing protein n=1 Tax=Saccharopolyspora sp. NPDC050389 TaxID=3155516 RepID=UPI0033C1DE9F
MGSRLRVTRYRHFIAARVQWVSATPCLLRGVRDGASCVAVAVPAPVLVDDADRSCARRRGGRCRRVEDGRLEVVPRSWRRDTCNRSGGRAEAQYSRLSFAEREEISCRRAAGDGIRAIARALGRSPSTVSRELARGTVRRKTGYRASVAQARADVRSAATEGLEAGAE